MKRLKIMIAGAVISAASCLVIGVSAPSWAVTNAHKGYCDDIESTAAALKCIKEHKESAEKNLKKTFNILNKNLEEEQKETFLKAHSDWITYRNSQCEWESNTVDPSLKKLHELSCLTKLTEDRQVRLQQKVDEQEVPAKTSEFSAYPLWLNKLNNDYPNVIWDIKSQITGDLTCDKRDETIIQGVLIQGSDLEVDESEDEFKIQAYVAIIDGEETKAPQIDIIEIAQECGAMPDLEYNLGSDTQEQKLCIPTLGIPSCQSVVTKWVDNQYKLIKEENLEKELEKLEGKTKKE